MLDAQQSNSTAYAESSNRLNDARGRLKGLQARLRDAESRNPLDRQFARQQLVPGGEYRPPGIERDQAILQNRERFIGPIRELQQQAQAECDRLVAHVETLKMRSSALPQRILTWAAQLDLSRPLEAYTGTVKVPKGDPRQLVEQLRRQIAELRAQRERIAAAWWPPNDCKRLIEQWIDAFAAKGRPDVTPTLERGAPPALAMTQLQSVGVVSFPMPDLQALLFWLGRDTLVAQFNALVDQQQANGHEVLSVAARRERQRQIDGEILMAERCEEQLIEGIERDSGEGPKRRDGADPRAVLTLASTLPASI
jgi:hypothetical protein